MEEHKKRLNADPSSFVELSEYPVKPDADESEKMVQFLCTVGKLKSIERTGWILDHRRTISKPETVAGHMYRMGIMGMLFDDDDDVKPTENGQLKKAKTEKLDISKMVQMSLVHDMAECITGDITPYDNINETEKHRRESEAMKNLVAMLPSSVARKFTKLYEEYEARETAESKVVKEFDRFDVMLQAYQYEREKWLSTKEVIRFDEFFILAQKHVHHPKLRNMLDRIIQERDHFLKENGSVDGDCKAPICKKKDAQDN